MKIKLRDLSEKQYLSWKKQNCNNCSICSQCVFNNVLCSSGMDKNWVNNKELYSDKFLDQEIEIADDILDKEEKKYLKNLLRPFKDRVKYIEKYVWIGGEKACIYIKFIDGFDLLMPEFDTETMYKGIKPYKEYTLKELGLYETR